MIQPIFAESFCVNSNLYLQTFSNFIQLWLLTYLKLLPKNFFLPLALMCAKKYVISVCSIYKFLSITVIHSFFVIRFLIFICQSNKSESLCCKLEFLNLSRDLILIFRHILNVSCMEQLNLFRNPWHCKTLLLLEICKSGKQRYFA